MNAILILLLLAAVGQPPLPDFSAIHTLTAGKDSPLAMTHSREDEVVPGQLAISCDAAGNCTGSVYGPVVGTVQDKTVMHYVWMHADGWNILLICREGWGNRCAPLVEDAEYDVLKWRGSATAQLTGGPGPYGEVTIPDAVELVPHGKKKPKVKYELASMFKTISEGTAREPRQVIFVDRPMFLPQ